MEGPPLPPETPARRVLVRRLVLIRRIRVPIRMVRKRVDWARTRQTVWIPALVEPVKPEGSLTKRGKHREISGATVLIPGTMAAGKVNCTRTYCDVVSFDLVIHWNDGIFQWIFSQANWDVLSVIAHCIVKAQHNACDPKKWRLSIWMVISIPDKWLILNWAANSVQYYSIMIFLNAILCFIVHTK